MTKTDYEKIQSQMFEKDIQEEIEDSFKLILNKKYKSLDKEKEVIKFEEFTETSVSLYHLLCCLLEPIKYGYKDLQGMKKNLYIRKIQVTLAQLDEDIKLHTYDFYSSGTSIFADVEFVKSAMEETLRKIKNYKII